MIDMTIPVRETLKEGGSEAQKRQVLREAQWLAPL